MPARSESERGFHQGSELLNRALRWCCLPQRSRQQKQSGSDADGVADRPGGPPFPHQTVIDCAGDHRLSHSHAEAVSIDQDIAPLQPKAPGLTVAVMAGVTPSATDRGKPATLLWLPGAADAEGMGEVRCELLITAHQG